jgi:hypothetical protein
LPLWCEEHFDLEGAIGELELTLVFPVATLFFIPINLMQFVWVVSSAKFTFHLWEHFELDICPDIALSFFEILSIQWLENDSDRHNILLGSKSLVIPVPLFKGLFL